MSVPPSKSGGDHETITSESPAVAMISIGLPGTVRGMIEFDVSDSYPVPTSLVAETLKVYSIPLINPSIVANGPCTVFSNSPG